ncbi:MAG: hypothetical protein LBI94_04450 [Treponema sp.]|jgi:hypothetical protein|nr:hypothetical protein [Treponema sp.]
MNTQTAGEPRVFRPLQWGLLVYEVFRLAVLVRIMTGDTLGGGFPGLIFGAANALFPLMALFLLVDFHRYAAYASLYAAGKILSVVVVVSCGFFWLDRIIQAIILEEAASAAGNLVLIAIGDLLSAGGGILLARRSRHGTAVKPAEQHTGETTAENGGL